MRNAFCDALVRVASRSDFVFLTGDLGFNALEPLQKAAGERFINAGIAEQNMVSVAAGLASQGWKPWAYSIAPFLYARPLEQIRNDVCLHDLPVKLVGNGGGYAYGVMGGSHHAIEDYGVLLSLQNLSAFVPAFREDVAPIIDKLLHFPHPAYLRLGRDEKPEGFLPQDYAPWRKLAEGGGPVILVIGPLVGGFLKPMAALAPERRPSLWVLSELPFVEKSIPDAFLEDLARSGHLAVVEEHVPHGSAGEMMARVLALAGKSPTRFNHFHARGYLSGFYGSQNFHRKECGLDAESVLQVLLA
jgi:transketolase